MRATKRAYPALMILFGVGLNSASAGMIDKAGMQPWEICGLCHGLDGNSHMAKFPKLAGQKADYIEKQFLDFRNLRRRNDGGQMEAITHEVDVQDIQSIAVYFAGQSAPTPAPVANINAQQLRQGRELYEQGHKNVPACISCHNANRKDTPWLDAQHQDYLIKQLHDFQREQRDNDLESTMRKVAKSLTDTEIEALAVYLSQTQLRNKPTESVAN